MTDDPRKAEALEVAARDWRIAADRMLGAPQPGALHVDWFGSWDMGVMNAWASRVGLAPRAPVAEGEGE